mmetsp:Transcript_136081/g.322533  ORF Transcript_136081/g.322533 Transcript_136081/m.322533 type:complete len:245 (+) Transcript_136081:1418-2152(+)
MASKVQYHSERKASTKPFLRYPVKVNFFINPSNISSSMSRMVDNAFEASWMGPPKRWKELACSKSDTLMVGSLLKALAKRRPPTPAPEMITCKGLAPEISVDFVALHTMLAARWSCRAALLRPAAAATARTTAPCTRAVGRLVVAVTRLCTGCACRDACDRTPREVAGEVLTKPMLGPEDDMIAKKKAPAAPAPTATLSSRVHGSMFALDFLGRAALPIRLRTSSDSLPRQGAGFGATKLARTA